MLAATLGGIRDIQVVEKPEPRIESPGDAVVEVEIAGLCGSDLHPWSGREVGCDPGTTMGHEFTGRVVAVGEEVVRLRPGATVLSPFSTSCGSCGPCRRGLSARCTRGAVLGWVCGGRGLEGAQAPLVRVPLAEATLVERPAGISAVESLLLGDVVSTGFYSVERAGVARGEPVVVLGLGAVGLAAVLRARSLGAAVAALDSVEERLRVAEAFGALPLPVGSSAGGPSAPADVAEEVRRLLDAEGAACVVDAVGSPEATRLAQEILRPGGFVSIVGVHTEGAFAVTPAAAYDKNVTLATGRCPVRSRLDAILRLQAEMRFPIERLVTHRFPLRAARDAYDIFAERRDGIIKAVFDPTG